MKVSLTGVKPTGMPHIGNYFGAIKPALELSKEYEARYFIADYHALNLMRDPAVLSEHTYDVAAVWLACGLDPERTLFYRQSDVPETFELTTMLMAFTTKGLMNRAHAYKDAVAKNLERERDPDEGVNMGLFTYPVLMAADILLFDPQVVPVGKDQKQHVEMTADIAEAINKNYGQDLFVIPEPVIGKETQTVIGLDGRKMSKSYGNTIPLFMEPKKLRKTVMKIVTTSQTVEEVKDPDTCNVFALYRLFADSAAQADMRKRYAAGGMGWGHAKQALFDLMEETVGPMREKYDRLIADRPYLDETLAKGAVKARELAAGKIAVLRKAMGIGGTP